MARLRFCFLILVLVPVLLQGCVAGQDSGKWRVVEIASPAGPGSGEPYLSVSGNRVYMSWLESMPQGGHALRFASLDGDRWSVPRDVVRGVPFFINWADFPSIQPLSDHSLIAHWLQKNGAGPYAYHIYVSVSRDQGASWSTPILPHTDRSTTEHGFVSLVDEGNGRAGAVWLDARNFKPGAMNEGAISNEMALMYSKFEGGAFQGETVLDSRVCDCCQTDAAVTSEGLFVVFRDRSASEVRDIGYMCRVDGKWTSPAILHADQWQIAACPVNGPAVVAEGASVVVVWFTGAGDRGRVQAIFSSDSGKTFGKPVQIDSGNPSGRVDIAVTPDHGALISWLENTPNQGAEIRARQVYPDGTTQPPFVIAGSSSARASGFPRLIRQGNTFLIAWTQASDPSQIRIARLEQW